MVTTSTYHGYRIAKFPDLEHKDSNDGIGKLIIIVQDKINKETPRCTQRHIGYACRDTHHVPREDKFKQTQAYSGPGAMISVPGIILVNK